MLVATIFYHHLQSPAPKCTVTNTDLTQDCTFEARKDTDLDSTSHLKTMPRWKTIILLILSELSVTLVFLRLYVNRVQ